MLSLMNIHFLIKHLGISIYPHPLSWLFPHLTFGLLLFWFPLHPPLSSLMSLTYRSLPLLRLLPPLPSLPFLSQHLLTPRLSLPSLPLGPLNTPWLRAPKLASTNLIHNMPTFMTLPPFPKSPELSALLLITLGGLKPCLTSYKSCLTTTRGHLFLMTHLCLSLVANEFLKLNST